jgi:enoyl-CoA hydratase/carnithine racemase
MAQHSQVRIEQLDDVAVLVLSRRPTNALSAALCQEMSALVTQVMGSDGVIGAVIASDLPVFSAGSDVGDILDPPKGNRDALQSLCAQIADAPKPIVAAIGGSCLSTGLDLALAAAGRVAEPAAQFGYPEMRLGLLPAGGGVYRLTQLIGAKETLAMVLGGDAQAAESALEIGLIDQICAAGGEVARAAQFVQKMAAQFGDARFARGVGQDRIARMAADMGAITEVRRQLQPYEPPWAAQHRLVDVVEAALLLPKDSALAVEATAFDEVSRGPIARALTYAFVARQRARSDGGALAKTLEPMLRQTMGQIEAHFQQRGMARGDVLGAMAAYGIAAPQGAALSACPKGAEDVMPALLLAWANLGAKMLRTAIAPRADVVDLAALNAGFFPNWRGGPMFIAGGRGALVIRAELQRRAADNPDVFAPDALWDDLVAQGLPLADYSAPITSAPNRV